MTLQYLFFLTINFPTFLFRLDTPLIVFDAAFDAPDLESKNITIDAAYIRKKLKDIIQDEDLSRYIL